MMNFNLKQQIALFRNWNRGVFPLVLPAALLIAVVVGLIVLMVSVCVKSTAGPLSMAALKDHLRLLQSKFASQAPVDPEQERIEMEKLENNIKAACPQKVISGNSELKALFLTNYHTVEVITGNQQTANRTEWLKLRELMSGFNDLYFQKRA
jgi:translation elongation factor EF-1beta